MHKRHLLRITALCLGLLMSSSLARAQESPLATALEYLTQNVKALGLTQADLADLVVTDQYVSKHTGVTHIYLQQRQASIPVHNAIINVNITRDGQVLNVGSRFILRLSERTNSSFPALTAIDAAEAAADHLDLTITEPLTVLQTTPGVLQETRLSTGGVALESIPVALVYQPLENGEVHLAWDVEIYTLDAMHWWRVRVDAGTGAFLDKHDQVVNDDFGPRAEAEGGAVFMPEQAPNILERSGRNPDSYRVFPLPAESPLHPSPGGTAHTIVMDPADATASPFGWHDTNGVPGAEFTDTQGNNVDAHSDLDGNNVPDPGSRPSGGPTLDFDYPINLAMEPGTYIPGAVVNLFYWNNIIHDVLYQYGFDEASGNFQENNYGNGGAGSDGVIADAQDNFNGGSRCNANFGTPIDGGNPRMQMFTCGNNPNIPERDGDLDNGVIIHEYGHGISNRLAGGPGTTSCLSNTEQMGEGWSDWYGLMMTQQLADTGPQARGIGTYLLGELATGPGIRARPYSTDFTVNDFTYDIIIGTGTSPHALGHVWATMIWDLNWALIGGDPNFPGVPPGDDGSGGGFGFDSDLYNGTGGNNLAMQLITDGLKLQPCSPGFVDGRDAILAADVALTGGANECTIWEAFARRGLGFSASQGSSNSRTDGTEAFDMPPTCMDLVVTKTATPSPVNDGSMLEYSIKVEAANNAQNNVMITDNVPSFTTYVSGSASDGGSETGGMVSFPAIPLINPGAMVIRTFKVLVNVGGSGGVLFEDDMESGPGNWTVSHDSGTLDWSLGTTNPHSGSSNWFADDTAVITDQFLALTTPVLLNAFSVLHFWHDYNLETTFDGGVIEISTDGGATWTDLGSNITQNGYTHTISTGFSSPIGGRQAFSGDSGGYLETVVDLGSFAGQTVQIRFRMATDDSVSDEGWYVDDVTIAIEALISNQACAISNETPTNCDLIMTAVILPTIRYVALPPTGNNTGDCTNPLTPCATLTYAVSQANDGDIIDLAAGTYNETVVIVKKLILQGQGVVVQ